MKKHNAIVIIVVAGMTLLGCGGADTSPDTTAAADITAVTGDSTAPKLAGVNINVTVGKDSSPDRTEKVALGAQVTLSLTNPDADDEFHLHGYDMTTGETTKGETSTITFVADKPGEFEVESHVTGQVYVVIVVGEP